MLSVSGDKVRLGITAPARRLGLPQRGLRLGSRARTSAEDGDDGENATTQVDGADRERSPMRCERARASAERQPISQASVSNIATTTITTVIVRQTTRTLKRTLPSLLGARDAAGPRAVGRALAQLLAPAPLERRLLLEGQLELSHALSHPHLSHRQYAPRDVAVR